MRFAPYSQSGRNGVAVANSQGEFVGLWADEFGSGRDIFDLIGLGGDALLDAGKHILTRGAAIDLSTVSFRVPVSRPRKILCVGLNYADHSAESQMDSPDYPTVFARFTSSLVSHREPLVLPKVSSMFDFEGELVAIIGKGGREIPESEALNHVVGYSVFNDGSVRDYQKRTPQWTVGKNFDGTGGFGPYLVTADELPVGAGGLRLVTRLNGKVLQDASTNDLLFSVAQLVSLLSVSMTLQPGDVIVTGTPAGVGFARTPPIFMQAGDVCEVDIEGVGCLSNTVVAQGNA